VGIRQHSVLGNDEAAASAAYADDGGPDALLDSADDFLELRENAHSSHLLVTCYLQVIRMGTINAMEASPLAWALERIGERWALLVVDALLDGPRRFNELQQMLPGIAPNVLSQRLRHLEREALVVARPYSQRPPRFEYELTAFGRELADALRLLADWGGRGAPDAEPLTHAGWHTGRSSLVVPDCAETVDMPEAADIEV
jgi:DNA-binding HxlR family transcriptional regulator